MKNKLIKWLLGLLGHNPDVVKGINIRYTVDDSALKSTLATLERMERISKRMNLNMAKHDYRTIDELIRIVENVIPDGFVLTYDKKSGWCAQSGEFKETAITQRQVLEELLLRLTAKVES